MPRPSPRTNRTRRVPHPAPQRGGAAAAPRAAGAAHGAVRRCAGVGCVFVRGRGPRLRAGARETRRPRLPPRLCRRVLLRRARCRGLECSARAASGPARPVASRLVHPAAPARRASRAARSIFVISIFVITSTADSLSCGTFRAGAACGCCRPGGGGAGRGSTR